MSELNVNSIDLDQTPHSAASDLGLHCLQMSLLWDTIVCSTAVPWKDIFSLGVLL